MEGQETEGTAEEEEEEERHRRLDALIDYTAVSTLHSTASSPAAPKLPLCQARSLRPEP